MSSRIVPCTDSWIEKAGALLSQGGVICFPTETVYGIGCDASNGDAVTRLYAIKARSEEKPLQILVRDLAIAKAIGVFNEPAERLAKHFWPGALTIIVQKHPQATISPMVNKANQTIGIRVPDHHVTQALSARFGKPIAATSANISGQANAITAEEIDRLLPGQVELILSGGPAFETGSTVVDMTGSSPRILREGVIGQKEILDFLSFRKPE